jgi:hypothetical protein
MNLGPRPASQPWMPAEDAQLLALLDSKMDRPSIARKLKRTVSAIAKRRFIFGKATSRTPSMYVDEKSMRP